MPYYLAAWLANLSFATSGIIGKLSVKHQIKNPWLYNFVWGLIVTVLTIPVALFYHPPLPTHWGALWIMGFFSMAAGVLYIFSLYALDISILAPLYNFRVVINIILGSLLFHEHLGGLQIGFMVLILICGLFVTADERLNIRSFFKKSIALGLITVTFSAVYGATVKYAMQFDPYWTVNMWGNILAQVLLLPTIWFFWKDIRNIRKDQWSGVIGHGGLTTIGSAAQNAAYAANISISTAILSVPSSMVIALLFSIFAPKLLEKHTMKIYAIRFTAAAVMIIAALQLSR